jgi:prepilin-type N-terminal cleavage/methylation domain-containing protein
MSTTGRLLRSATGGFTLIETLVALGVFTIGLVGVTSMLVQSARANAANEARTQAGILVESILEELEALAGDPANFADNGSFIMPEGQVALWQGAVASGLPSGALYVTADNFLVAGEFSNEIVVDVGWGEAAASGPQTSLRAHRRHAVKRFTAR